ncbi:MAG: hypothetical protein J1G06_06520 [Oscillospiraceae bacterium]|nr:hypothetical protein [Oscillospiraceae bacterium]
MRKRIYIVLYILIVFIMSAYMSVHAAEMNTYTINELGLSIKIPDNYAVVTRDINENDSSLKVFARTKDDMVSFMTARSIYLDAFDENTNNEIVITKTDNDFIDLNYLSDDTLLDLIEEMKSEYEAVGITYIRSETYDNGTMKFAKIYISQPNGSNTAYGLQYYTIYNKQAINITIHSYANLITQETEALMKNIVDSASFNGGIQSSDLKSDANEYEYVDNETNLSFTVPANYTQQAVSDDQKFIDAIFVCDDKNEVCIFYGSTDLFESIPKDERKGLRRQDCNNETLTEKDYAEILGITAEDVEKVFYGNKEYYKFVIQRVDDSTGIELQLSIINLVHIENGYIYQFQFSGRESSPYYADFERLISNAHYENVHYDEPQSDWGIKDIIYSILFGFLLTIVIYSLPIIIYRYVIRRKPVKPSTAKKITIIYGIAAFIAMLIVLVLLGGKGAGSAIVLWSYINYRMLISGYIPEE